MQPSVADQFFSSASPTPIEMLLSDISPMEEESPDRIPCFSAEMAIPAPSGTGHQFPSNLLHIADEDTPALTADQFSTFTRATSAIASESSAIGPYTQPAPARDAQASDDLNDSVIRALTEAVEQQVVPTAQNAGGNQFIITPEKVQLRMEVQSMQQQLVSTQMLANNALELQRRQAQTELDNQQTAFQVAQLRVTKEAQASVAVVAGEADRVNVNHEIALKNASLRLQSESQAMDTLRTELAGRNVSNNLMLQSAVIEVQNRSEVRLNEQRQRTDNELIRQRTTFSQESIEWQRNEQAEMGRLRNEQLVHEQSIVQLKNALGVQNKDLTLAQESLKLEQDKTAKAHVQLVDLQSRLNASDFFARQLQSEVAQRDARIQQLIASESSAGNAQSIDAAVQAATMSINATNQAAVREMEKAFEIQKQVITSMWEGKYSEAKSEADLASRKNKDFKTELVDMQDQLQDFYDREQRREEADEAKAKAPAREATDQACPPPPAALVPTTLPKASESSTARDDEKELAPPDIKFSKWPTPHEFTQWLHTWHMQISHAARDPDHAYKWIKKVREVTSFAELADTEGYPRLDSKICATVHSQFQGELKREVRLIGIKNEETTGKLLNGRQLCWIMYDSLDRTQLEGAIHTVDDLLNLEMFGQKLREFWNAWEEVLQSLSNHPALVPTEPMLESLFLRQIRKYDGLKLQIHKYEEDVTMNGQPRDYQRLRKIIEICLHQQKLKANNRKYANGSDNRAATPVGPSADQRRKSPNGKGSGKRAKTPEAGKKQQGDCFAWTNKGTCYKGSDCSFEHVESKKGSGKKSPRKNSRDDKKSSKDNRGRSDSRNTKDKRNASPSRPKTGQQYRGPTGTSPSGKEKREPCKMWLKGTCDKGKKCDFWHTGTCNNFAQGKCDRKDCIFKHTKKAFPASDKTKEQKKKEKKKKAKLAHHHGCIAKLEAESDEEEDDDQPEEETEGDQEAEDSESQQNEASESSAEDSQDEE